MPSTGPIAVPGPAEVVLPFESKTKDIIKLLAQDPAQTASDQQFLKDGKQATPNTAQLGILNACLSAVTVLSFLGGPAGIVFASGLSLFQGLLSVAAQQNTDTLGEMTKGLKTVQDHERTVNQLAKVKSVANIIDTQWKSVVDNLSSGSVVEKLKVDDQLSAETGVQADSLAKSLFQMEDILEWDNIDVRITVLMALTYLFVVWNLQCRLWASLVRIESDKKDKMDQKTYDTYVTTFRFRVREMKNELDARTQKLRTLYASMKEKHTGTLTWTGAVKHDSPAFAPSNTVTTYLEWKDDYNGKNYQQAAAISWWRSSSTEEQVKDATDVAQKQFDTYKQGLADFATRAIANDLAVVDQWAGIVSEAEKLLLPPAPGVPPTVDHYQATNTTKVHAYLKDAHWVSYAYSVGTSADGDSQISPWTDWLELRTDENGQILLPVLVIRDSDQVVETRRTVYHRRNMDVKPADTKPAPTDKILDEWKSEVFTANGSQLWIEP